jgi:hypothetical protein
MAVNARESAFVYVSNINSDTGKGESMLELHRAGRDCTTGLVI